MSLKIKKFLLLLVTVISVITTIVAGGDMVLRFCVAPKLGINKNLIPTAKDIVKVTRFATNDQLWKNIENFDKAAAKEVLDVLLELEEDISKEVLAKLEETKSQQGLEILPPSRDSQMPALLPNSVQNPQTEKPQVKPDDTMQDAIDRILQAATKAEIEAGMAILMKVDLEKVKGLQEAGKTEELKKYIRSVLTTAEINKSVSLYNKYKHLL